MRSRKFSSEGRAGSILRGLGIKPVFPARGLTDDMAQGVLDIVGMGYFSAGLVVDLGNTAQEFVSIQDTPFLSGGAVFPWSGAVIGQGGDMINSDTYCNLHVAGVAASGRLRVAVQTAPSDVSGQYTDPTSGLANLPGAFQSGGILWINSGSDNGVLGAFVSGQCIASGFAVSQGFQRPGRYVRAVLLSGDPYAGSLCVSFISQLRTTGSGGGFSLQPSSGSVNV